MQDVYKRQVPAPRTVGRPELGLYRVLEHLILLGNVRPVVYLLKGPGAVIEDVALGRQVPSLVDGGILAVGCIVKIELGRFRQRELPACVHQMPPVVLVVLDRRQQRVRCV